MILTRLTLGVSSLLVLLSAFAASASGHAFIASKAGTVEGKQLNTQKLLAGSLSISCSTATVKGSIASSEEEARFGKDVVQYGGCEAGATKVTISEADYEFDAEGALRIVEPIVISDAPAKCTVKVSATPRAGSTTVKYANGTKLEVAVTVSGLSDEPSGGACGSAKPQTNGQIEGTLGLSLASGTLKWGTQAVTTEPEYKFGEGNPPETQITTIHFADLTEVDEAGINPDNEGFDFVSGRDFCSFFEITPGGTCSIETEFDRPGPGFYEAWLEIPYRIVASGVHGRIVEELTSL
jgi:hypothetical protein